MATDLLDWLFFNFCNLLFQCTMKHFFITHYKKYAKKFISVLKSLKHVWWIGNNILLHSLSHSWNSAAAHIWSIKQSVIIYQKNTKYFIKSLNTFAKFIRGRVPPLNKSDHSKHSSLVPDLQKTCLYVSRALNRICLSKKLLPIFEVKHPYFCFDTSGSHITWYGKVYIYLRNIFIYSTCSIMVPSCFLLRR